MEKIAVFVNEVAHARHILQPMVNGQGMTHWVLIACPPKLTRHIGRWLSRSAQDQWKERWSLELFAGIEPLLKARTGNKVEKLLAKRPLVDMSKRLETRLGGVSFLDARCPTLYKQHERLTSSQPSADSNQWTYPLAVTTGLSAMLALAD